MIPNILELYGCPKGSFDKLPVNGTLVITELSNLTVIFLSNKQCSTTSSPSIHRPLTPSRVVCEVPLPQRGPKSDLTIHLHNLPIRLSVHASVLSMDYHLVQVHVLHSLHVDLSMPFGTLSDSNPIQSSPLQSGPMSPFQKLAHLHLPCPGCVCMPYTLFQID